MMDDPIGSTKKILRKDSIFLNDSNQSLPANRFFHPSSSNKEGEDLSMSQFVVSKINEMFIAGIPIRYVRTLPKMYMYTLGAMSYLILMTLFALFFIATYRSNLNTSYISLDSSSGICHEVPSSVSGSYYATVHGEWQGNSNFIYTDAPFYFIFTDMSTTLKRFQHEISILNDIIHDLGENAKNQSLSYNILIWAHYRHYFTFDLNSSFTTQKQQLFQFVGTPNDIFNREFMFSGLGNAQQLCSAFPMLTYLKESAMLNLAWSHTVYEDKNCSQIMDAVHAGYSEENDSFILHVDMITFMTTVALNSGVINLDVLLPLTATQLDIPLLNTSVYGNYNILLSFDSMFPRMTPVWCLQSTPLHACFVAIPNDVHLSSGVKYPTTYAIPIMTHFLLDCEYCTDQTKNLTYCSNFDFNIALITFPDESSIFDLALKYASNHRQLYYDAYPAIAQILNDTNPSPELYEFCWYRCSILAINIFDYTDYNINPYFFSLNPETGHAGACFDSFSTPHFTHLASSSNLPAPLTEKYFECDNTKASSLINAIGIASGNTASFGPILIIMLLPLLYLYLQATKQSLHYDKHTLHEKEMATHELISYLLKIRDNDLQHVNPDGILVKIVQELKEINEKIVFTENLRKQGAKVNGDAPAPTSENPEDDGNHTPLERFSFLTRPSRCEAKIQSIRLDDDSQRDENGISLNPMVDHERSSKVS